MARPSPSVEKHALYARYLEARHDRHMDGSWREFRALFYEAPPLTREVTRAKLRALAAGAAQVRAEL